MFAEAQDVITYLLMMTHIYYNVKKSKQKVKYPIYIEYYPLEALLNSNVCCVNYTKPLHLGCTDVLWLKYAAS